MSKSEVIRDLEKDYLKERERINIGDNVQISLRIVEGDNERVQIFSGTVIAKKGEGASATISVYRNAYGCSMERVFLVNSPKISGIKKVRSSKVRRSKLYYLRGASGKAARLNEKIEGKEEVAVAEIATAAPQAAE